MLPLIDEQYSLFQKLGHFKSTYLLHVTMTSVTVHIVNHLCVMTVTMQVVFYYTSFSKVT